MMRSITQLALVAGIIAQVYQPPLTFHPRDFIERSLPSLSKRRNFEPCAEIRSLWAAQKAELSKPEAVQETIRVPAQCAYDCLMSVPVDVEGDLREIEELKAFLQWQSTLAWLKSGVEGHIEPHDIMGLLDSIALAVKENKGFISDYEVQLSIRRILDAAGDYHLRYDPDITNVFLFARPGGQIVSVSEDGVSLPKLYLASDLLNVNKSNVSASAVLKINGEDASKAMDRLSNGTHYYDADARYNTIFPNPVTTARVGGDGGALSFSHYVYPGPTTNFTFANKTEKVIDNVAYIASNFDFSNVTDGASFFKAFCNGPDQPAVQPPTKESPSPTPSSVASPTPKPSPSLLGYPKPVFLHGSKMVSGYHLSDDDYKDISVLAMSSFNIPSLDPLYADETDRGGLIEPQTLIRNFLTDAVKQNKKKLVVDLRSNGGGSIDLSFELFKQLFPTIEPYGAARYRAHEAFHFYSALVADLALEGRDRDGQVNRTNWDDADYGVQSTFLWSNVLDENLKPYKTYEDYYGPETIHNDTFSSIRRYNFSNNLGGHYINASITGYNELKNALAQPFQADNIVLLQDGLCGSACTIFSELMREQGKVQSIVIGGRPRNEPMQGIGGTKGVQLLGFDTIADFAEHTIEGAKTLDGEAVAKYLNDTTNVGKIHNAQQIYRRTSIQPDAKLAGGVTSLNNQRQGDMTQTPLQFIYEAADCRLFYTTASYLDPVNLWKMVVDAKWGKGKCVPGSTGHKTAIGTVENRPGFGAKGVSQQSNSDGATFQTTGAAASKSASGVIMALAGIAVLIVAF